MVLFFAAFQPQCLDRLESVRQLKEPGFADSAGTQEFTLLLNDLFHILNSKIPAAGIRNGSPKIKVCYACKFFIY